MGKNSYFLQQSNKSKLDNPSKKKKPGRPSNIQIQTLFMNTIRDTKLQAINAETELQLEMAFFTTEDEKKSRKKEQASTKDKQERIFSFSELTVDQKNSLTEFFQNQRKTWKFDQVEQQSDLPEYFFDDENDLAFILYHLIGHKFEEVKNRCQMNRLKSRMSDQTLIRGEELFFLTLLCLNAQQGLRDQVLDFILKNQSLIVNLIKASLQKLKAKHQEKVQNNIQKQKISSLHSHAKGLIDQDILYEQQIGEQSTGRGGGAAKKIKKGAKKSGKGKKLQSESQDEPILNQKQKQEKLMLCFVNYIIWNYYYVYPEEQKLIANHLVR